MVFHHLVSARTSRNNTHGCKGSLPCLPCCASYLILLKISYEAVKKRTEADIRIVEELPETRLDEGSPRKLRV